MKEKVARISLSIQPDLLAELESLTKKLRYPSRSLALNEAIREFISSRKWLKNEKGSRVGAILLTYDHDVKGINDLLTATQHSFKDIIVSSMHLHLDEHTCLEIIAVKGNSTKLKELAERLMTRKGILNLKVMTSYSK